LILSERGVNRRFKFQKRSQLFLRVHNETLTVVAMRSGLSAEQFSPKRP
jgi:hypothetical protein